MKKYWMLFFLLLFVGCGKKEPPISLSQLKEPLAELTVNPFDPTRVVAKIEEDRFEVPLRNVTEEEMRAFGIEEELEDGIFRTSTDSKEVEFYYMIKPKKGKEEQLKQAMTTYFEQQKKQADEADQQVIYETRLEEEYQGYFLYVGSKKAKDILNEIKKTKTLVFPHLRIIDETELKNYGLNKEEVESFLIGESASLNQETFFVLVRPKKGTSSKEALEKEKEKRIQETEGEVQKLYQESMITEEDGISIWIVSPHHDQVLETIKKNLKK